MKMKGFEFEVTPNGARKVRVGEIDVSNYIVIIVLIMVLLIVALAFTS
uniref:Uncharacterized protein n=1 Tax=uncultured Thiotrichaceae bacterium TaxID=298394 RepID=A0A6S6U189_9GAMM|nr:MAG: Unknown protein [uncultured Thiotrichaceae bacterium]